jgi:hypothetical protein
MRGALREVQEAAGAARVLEYLMGCRGNVGRRLQDTTTLFLSCWMLGHTVVPCRYQ